MVSAATAQELALASDFQRRIGGPSSRAMEIAVTAWERVESGGLSHVIDNNPFNLRPGSDDADLRSGVRTAQNGSLFSMYPTLSKGYQAAAERLVSAGHDWRRYDAVVAAARAGNPVGFLNALAASAWDAGRYGTRNGGTNKLLTVYTLLAPTTTYSGVNRMITYATTTATANRMSLRQGQAVYDAPGGKIVTRLSKDSNVPHGGLAGKGWRLVYIGTAAPYADHTVRLTGVYVPVTAGTIVPSPWSR